VKAILEAVDVEEIAAVVGNQRIYEQHVGASSTSCQARFPMNPSPPVTITRRPR
jgi:hypothetical protein